MEASLEDLIKNDLAQFKYIPLTPSDVKKSLWCQYLT